MRQELDEKLVKKYPKIFVDRHENIKNTAMCWGFECSDAWYFLIDNLCEHIQSYIDNNKHLNITQVVAIQVKEKYGTLRWYYHGGNEYIDGMVSHTKYLTGKICADCGSMADIGYTLGWITYLCRNCFTNTARKGSTWVPIENNKDEAEKITI